jgi:hypothetical protein
MRFEKAFKKMTSPKKLNIRALADLTKPDNLNNLQKELLHAWDMVFLFDSSLLVNVSISDREKVFLHHCRDPKFWKKIKNRNTRKRTKDRFKLLLFRFGSNGNVHNEVKELLINEFKMCTVLPDAKLNEEIKNGTVLPTAKSEAEEQNVYGFTVNIESKTVPIQNRYCKGCGNPLNPGQKKNSLFCSAKYVGYEKAHQCRNIVFNPSNNFRNKLIKIETNGLLFDINPFFEVQSIAKHCDK